VAVAVVGPDGAGKSSVVTALTRTYPFPVLSYYAGQYALDARPARLARLPGGHTMGLLGRQARVSLVALGHALRGRVVVFDRYAYDSLLARPGASLKTRARRALLGRVALRPRLVVVLDAPGEVLHARSGEHSAQALEEQRGRYAALARSQPGWVVVDATGTADDVRRAVTAQLWACHSGVWRPPRTARATPRATARPGGRRGPAGAG
jgi:thymidylate kinase